jgi:hypothetical protein
VMSSVGDEFRAGWMLIEKVSFYRSETVSSKVFAFAVLHNAINGKIFYCDLQMKIKGALRRLFRRQIFFVKLANRF